MLDLVQALRLPWVQRLRCPCDYIAELQCFQARQAGAGRQPQTFISTNFSHRGVGDASVLANVSCDAVEVQRTAAYKRWLVQGRCTGHADISRWAGWPLCMSLGNHTQAIHWLTRFDTYMGGVRQAGAASEASTAWAEGLAGDFAGALLLPLLLPLPALLTSETFFFLGGVGPGDPFFLAPLLASDEPPDGLSQGPPAFLLA